MARSFDVRTLTRLRSVPVRQALDALGLFVKADNDFSPVKNQATVRLWVSVDATVYEVLVTGEKWFDARDERGGGGPIDLCMHLFQLDFVAAVKRLLKVGL